MANAQWPAGLPQEPIRPYKDVRVANKQVSKTDRGRHKVRLKSTGKVRRISATYKIIQAQIATFETFHDDTLGGGVAVFDWPDPKTGTDPLGLTAVMFDPEARDAFAIDPHSKDRGKWILSVKLLTQPV